jgi:hypothetical protein
MHQVTITFPELHFRQSAGHKIRGYFATWWREKSDLLHNHTSDGKNIYRYPLVQYKVLRSTPAIIGLGEGAKLLVEMFLNLEELVIENETYPLANKNIRSQKVEIGLSDKQHNYQFLSPWMALNPKNYHEYIEAGEEEKERILKSILIRNVLAFFKATEVWLDGKLEVDIRVQAIPANFKSQKMVAFKGSFKINALLPDLIGLGKSTSRGYGTIQKV